MMGCMLAYVLLLLLASKDIEVVLLLRSDWSVASSNLNLMVTALSFQSIVPSLPKIMNSLSEVRQAIFWGSSLPLVMYVLWEGAILGSLQPGAEMHDVGDVIEGLKLVGGQHVVFAFEAFSFLAIVTSFLGLSLGCLDFVQDLISGLNLAELAGACNLTSFFTVNGIERFVSMMIFMVPSYLIGVSFPTLFLAALDFSGMLRLIVYSIMPAMMVWSGRNYQSRKPHVWGGQGLLISIVVASVGMIIIGLG